MIDVLKDKTIRFIPKDIQPNDPVNRFRCYYIIEELRKKGYNANVYIRHEEKPDIIITLSLDFPKWSNIYEQCLTSDSIVILDLTENEFERSAIVSKKKIANFFTSVRFRPKKILNRLLGFIRRKAFDKDFYGFVASCDAITASSSRFSFIHVRASGQSLTGALMGIDEEMRVVGV